jgi:hypothetical protein
VSWMASWTFEPLKVEELRQVSKGIWGNHQVQKLNRQLELYCSVPQDRLPAAPKASEESKARVKKVKKEIFAIDASLRNLRTAGVILPDDIPNQFMSRVHEGRPVRLSLLARRGSLDRELQSLRLRRGRKPNLALDYFIKIVADACHVAGVGPLAERSKRWDSEEELDTPFLRVLYLAHERLPADRRASSRSALAWQARNSGLPWWRTITLGHPEPKRLNKLKGNDLSRE